MVENFDIFELTNPLDSTWKKGQSYKDPNVGRFLCAHPPDQDIIINTTTNPGESEKVYYSFCFYMDNEGYNVQKFSEWIDVGTADQAEYQRIEQQRDALENKIKEGLSRIGQNIADYELALHDLREYKKFLKLDARGKVILEKGKPLLTEDEETLKTIFVKEVDYYTGGVGAQGGAGRLSMEFMRNNNILPTIVEDFITMKSEEDLDKGNLKELPKVEKDLLRTKWRAYELWKTIFVREIVDRYDRLQQLVKSRKMTIDEYRDWLKPTIAKYKLIKQGLSLRPQRAMERSSFLSSPRRGNVYNNIVIWFWKEFTPTELYKTHGELKAKRPIPVDDEWTKREMIFNKKNGLISKYPWITEKWVEDKKDEMYKRKSPAEPISIWLKKDFEYYTLFTLEVRRSNMKLSGGGEMEDCDFVANAYMMSQNMLFVKLLHLKAEEEEFERYLDHILGLKPKEIGTEGEVINYKKNLIGGVVVKEIGEKIITKDDIKKNKKDYVFSSLNKLKEKYKSEDYSYIKIEKGILKPVKSFFNYFGLNFQFLKRGPYERDYMDRITHFYLKEMGQYRFFPKVAGKLKEMTAEKWV